MLNVQRLKETDRGRFSYVKLVSQADLILRVKPNQIEGNCNVNFRHTKLITKCLLSVDVLCLIYGHSGLRELIYGHLGLRELI